MKNLTKKDVYVKIDTKEKCKRVLEILKDEPVYIGVVENISKTGLNSGFIYLNFYNNWCGCSIIPNKTEVTLEQLAEILCIKQQFKVGDRVRIKESSEYYGYNTKFNPRDTDGVITGLKVAKYNTRVKWSNNELNWYKGDSDLELVEAGKETAIETVTISRANLG